MVVSAARCILSVSHKQTSPACLPNTVTAAETEAISLTCLKCKWTCLRRSKKKKKTKKKRRKSSSLSVGGRCHTQHKEHKMWGGAKANTFCTSKAFLGVSAGFPLTTNICLITSRKLVSPYKLIFESMFDLWVAVFRILSSPPTFFFLVF